VNDDMSPPPSSIPNGLTVQLYRGRVRPGRSALVDEWMAMLNDRLDEAVATTARERMGVEIVFRSREGEDEYLYWVVVRGEGRDVSTSHAPLDVDHLDYDRRCREPDWEVAQPALLLLPDPVRAAVLSWCRVPDDTG
jgi:hypothetical protein